MTDAPTLYRVLSPARLPGGKRVAVFLDASGDLQARAAAAGAPLSVFVQHVNISDVVLRVFTPEREKGESDSGALAALAALGASGQVLDVTDVTMAGETTPAQLCGGEWLLRQGDPQVREAAAEGLAGRLGLAAVGAVHAARIGRPNLAVEVHSSEALQAAAPDKGAVEALGAATDTTGLILYSLGTPSGLGRADVSFRAFGPLRGFFEDAASSNMFACLVGVLGARGLLPDGNLLRGLQLKPGQPARLTAQFVARPTGEGPAGASDLWVGGSALPEEAGVPGAPSDGRGAPTRRLAPTLAQLRQDLSAQAVFAGFLTVFVGLASTVTLLFQAAQVMHLSPAQTVSWLLAVCLSVGVSGWLLSWRFRAPIATAYALPGIVLLIQDGAQFSYPEVIGALLLTAAILTALGLSGLFDWVSARIPAPLAAAVLAGILLPFGLRSFAALPTSPVVVGGMVLAYVLGRALAPRYAVPAVLGAGLLLAWLTGGLDLRALAQVGGGLPRLVVTAPAFSLRSVLVLTLPLLAFCFTTQHLPGLAVLRANGYARVPAGPLVSLTSFASLLTAPFGAHTTTLAAITAALCSGPEAHPDPARRYVAGLSAAVFYLLAGLGAGLLAGVFALLPAPLVQALAGLALAATILGSLTSALHEPRWREAAVLTLLVTASGLSFLGLGSAFWGLVVGALSAWLLRGRA